MKIPKIETGTLLIAAPELQGEEFHRTVIYLTSYNEKGVTGLVQNRPMKIFLGQIFPEIKQAIPVFWGGPIPERHFTLPAQRSGTDPGKHKSRRLHLSGR